ncbi:MAG: response regulator [Candidatus Eisenbacteria bacterium]|nr:response regulator [Candidatus Eisenbacteria bacterium]
MTHTPPLILIVEDVPTILTALRMRLEAEGFTVAEARDGVEAIDRARERHPDLIVLDLMLPRLSGERVCEVLRGDPQLRGVPIVVLSARVGESERLRAFAAGADAFLSKPYDVAQLMGEIRARLGATKGHAA